MSDALKKQHTPQPLLHRVITECEHVGVIVLYSYVVILLRPTRAYKSVKLF